MYNLFEYLLITRSDEFPTHLLGYTVMETEKKFFILPRDEPSEISFAVVINDTKGFTGIMREWKDNAVKNIS